MTEASRPHVGLFVTCLVDFFRPNVGFAAVKLLEEAGCRVSVPTQQTCCGQPAYNSGDMADTVAVARGVIEAFSAFDYVVAPSGSCAGMIRKHYPGLFAEGTPERAEADALSKKTYELVSFLVDVRGMSSVPGDYAGTVTYHDSCSGLRELDVRDQPRKLLGSMSGVRLKEMKDAEVCCGFGGTFCVKYPDVSNVMVSKKIGNASETSADMLLAGDLGCLLNMAGKFSREGSAMDVRHVAEVLAGLTDEPAIGKN